MPRLRLRHYLAAALLLLAIVFATYYRLPALAYYWLSMQHGASQWRHEGLWLPAYRVTVEGLAVEGVGGNLSGLTFNERTGTLFAIINRPAEIVELSTAGAVLRRIAIRGASDTEGISHIVDDLFVIADEHRHQLHFVRIGEDVTEVDVGEAPTVGLAIDLTRNLGFEGVSWDAANRRLYVGKERSPMRVLTVDGLETLVNGQRIDLQIGEWKPPRARTLFMRDLSSLSAHEATGNILLLSDESALIVEYAPDGTPVSMLPMWRGLHGLRRSVPQAEGLAIGPDGTLYVLSEPNLFYRFERNDPARWAAAQRSDGDGS